jgi:AraC-like DNA-binding protein
MSCSDGLDWLDVSTFEPRSIVRKIGMQDDYIRLDLNSSPESRELWRFGIASVLGMNCDMGSGDAVGSNLAAWPLGRIDILSGNFTHLSMTPVANEANRWLWVKLVSRGMMYIEQGKQRRRFGPGEIVLVDSTLPHSQAFEKPTELVALRVPTDVLKERGLRHNLRGLVKPDASAADVRAIGEMILAIAWQRGRTSAILRRHQGEQLLNLIDLLVEEPSSLVRVRGESSTLERAKQFIEKNLRNPELTAPMIASAVCVSNSHLSRLFRAHGQSLMGYLWNRRLTLAVDMLTRSNGNVQPGDIAFRCGFSNHAHFSRIYKKFYGLTAVDALAIDAREPGCRT